MDPTVAIAVVAFIIGALWGIYVVPWLVDRRMWVLAVISPAVFTLVVALNASV